MANQQECFDNSKVKLKYSIDNFCNTWSVYKPRHKPTSIEDILVTIE